MSSHPENPVARGKGKLVANLMLDGKNNDEIRESELVSYIPGGVRFRGKVLKKAQIIPAELGVVHVQEIG